MHGSWSVDADRRNLLRTDDPKNLECVTWVHDVFHVNLKIQLLDVDWDFITWLIEISPEAVILDRTRWQTSIGQANLEPDENRLYEFIDNLYVRYSKQGQ